MNKPLLWRKLQYYRLQKRQIRSGSIYHKHCNQIIVSKQELYIQLQESRFNENLLACLAFGSDNPQYAYLLLMASLKFWFIGSLACPRRRRCRNKSIAAAAKAKDKSMKISTDEYDIAKLPRKCYERELFDNFLESTKEAQDLLNQLSRRYRGEKTVVTKETLLNKYTAVKNACMRMLTSTREFYFVQEYKNIIDYIATHDDTTLTFRNEFDDMPVLPDGYGEYRYYDNLYG